MKVSTHCPACAEHKVVFKAAEQKGNRLVTIMVGGSCCQAHAAALRALG